MDHNPVRWLSQTAIATPQDMFSNFRIVRQQALAFRQSPHMKLLDCSSLKRRWRTSRSRATKGQSLHLRRTSSECHRSSKAGTNASPSTSIVTTRPPSTHTIPHTNNLPLPGTIDTDTRYCAHRLTTSIF